MLSQEDLEYNIFMAKLTDKLNELKSDYNRLSETNKIRVEQESKRILSAMGMIEFIRRNI